MTGVQTCALPIYTYPIPPHSQPIRNHRSPINPALMVLNAAHKVQTLRREVGADPSLPQLPPHIRDSIELSTKIIRLLLVSPQIKHLSLEVQPDSREVARSQAHEEDLDGQPTSNPGSTVNLSLSAFTRYRAPEPLHAFKYTSVPTPADDVVPGFFNPLLSDDHRERVFLRALFGGGQSSSSDDSDL